MYNRRSLSAVQKSNYLEKEFCLPLYDTYCFSQIPQTIERLLLGGKEGLPDDTLLSPGKEYDLVILLFLDGFGWRFFAENAERYPFLQRFVEKGVVSQITSQFPSTTAAHVTSMCSGLHVGESGVYEWFMYEPMVDAIIKPLLAAFGEEKKIDSLPLDNNSLRDLYPKERFFERIKERNVNSTAVIPDNIFDSFYSKTMLEGADRESFHGLADGLEKLVQLSNGEGKCCLYFYYPDLDGVAHRHGIRSNEFEKELDHMLCTIEEKLCKPLEKNGKNGALLVTADHGLIDIDPKATFYLNEEFPEVLSMIEKSKRGIKAPAGSSRDFFLHIEPQKLEEAHRRLSDLLEGLAYVIPTQKLIEDGLFGKVSQRFHDRVGNLVILARDNQAIWWHEKGKYGQHFYAMHGGLSRSEMETIFLFGEF